MGDTVLSVSGLESGRGYLRIYPHCNRNGSGVTLLVMNIAPNTTFVLDGAGGAAASLLPREEYVLTGEALTSRYISLNGAMLAVGADGATLPTMLPRKEATAATFAIGPVVAFC